MNAMQTTLHYLFSCWGVVTTILAVLVIYGNTLSTREDGQLYLSKEEDAIMGSEQRALVVRMHHLAEAIAVLAVLSGILFVAAATVWAWIGLS